MPKKKDSSTLTDTAKYWLLGGGGTGLTFLKGLYDYGTAGGGKNGGRVTPKGIGKATHGYGKAMKKQGKK